MVEIQKKELSRAIYHHKLDAKYSCEWVSHHECRGEWKLGYEVFGKETHIIDYKNGDTFKVIVTEYFKQRYIDTIPDNVWRCRTCAMLHGCKHVRKDMECFCPLWHTQKTHTA